MICCGIGMLGSEAAKPPMPVTVLFRKSVLSDGGLVVQIQSQSQENLVLDVTMTSRTGNSKKLSVPVLPKGTQEVGWLQGWQCESGDTCLVEHEKYRSVTYRVP